MRKYDRKTSLIPYWNSETIYLETIMFMEGDKEEKLMMPAAEIYEVCSSDLKTVYEEGKDYILCDGCVKIGSNSSIPVMSFAEYYPEEAIPGTYFESDVEGHPLIRYSEEPIFVSKQVCVTYRPSVSWSGPIPEKQDKFGRFLSKLNGGKECRIVYFGDSITTGRNSSAWLSREPFAESWFDMVTETMKEKSGNNLLRDINTAENGADSCWALEHTEERIIAEKPDLLIYAYGMNDGGGKTAETFIDLTDKMVSKVQRACPDCDILLVSTMLPHWRFKGFWGHQCEYEAAMKEYVKDKEHIGLAPVSGIHRFMLERKEYYHATGNNVNHPNDFLHRMYAQTVLKVIFG